MTPATNKNIIEKINDLEERIEDVITQKRDYYSLWETVDKIMVEIYALKSKADKKENTVVKYGVKLADKSSDEITVDGITITHRWKGIKEKTKALQEYEEKGVIIIEETNYSALQDARNRLAINISYSTFQDARLIFQAMLTKPENILSPAFRDLRVKFEAMCSSQAFKDSQLRLASILMNPSLQDVKHITILSVPTSQDARERLATILSDSLMEVKREIKPHTEPETKKEKNKIEQQPISTELTKITERINDFEKGSEDFKTQEHENKDIWETLEKILVEYEALKKRFDEYENKGIPNIGSENKSGKKRLPKSESQIEKIPRNGSGKAENEIDKFPCLGTKEQFERIFKILIEKKYIKPMEYIEFIEHFDIDGMVKSKNKIPFKMIWWQKTERKLVYIVNEFILKKVIEDCHQHILTENHFCDKHGRRYKAKQLANSLQQVAHQIDQIKEKNKKNIYGEIDEIVKEVVNLGR